jgi:hypothetical protein
MLCVRSVLLVVFEPILIEFVILLMWESIPTQIDDSSQVGFSAHRFSWVKGAYYLCMDQLMMTQLVLVRSK